jgi:uncharacterized RDD family membrane protein YckC
MNNHINNYPYPLANPRHRIAGFFVDCGLIFVTLFIGWFIWSLIVLKDGQTPGMKLVKLRFYDRTTGLPTRWGHTFIRTYGMRFTFTFIAFCVGQLINSVIGFHSSTAGSSSNALLPLGAESFIEYIAPIVDLLWIFKGATRQRIVDIIFKTSVLNEAIAE